MRFTIELIFYFFLADSNTKESDSRSSATNMESMDKENVAPAPLPTNSTQTSKFARNCVCLIYLYKIRAIEFLSLKKSQVFKLFID